MFRTFEVPDDLRVKLLLPFLSTKAKSLISRLATVKAKFHYTSWFGAGSELIRSWFEAKFHYAIWFELASNQLRTS